MTVFFVWRVMIWNMFSILPSTILALSLLFSGLLMAQQETLPPVRSEPGMKAELESVYLQWRNAMIRKNLGEWENSTAMYRQMTTKNRIISEKHRFPDSLFNSPVSPPALANLMHLAVLTRRDTASMVYFGKANFGVGDASQVTDTFLVLRYLKEDGRWRFDNSRIVRIGKDNDVLHKIRVRDFSFLQAEEFQPLSFIPEIQQQVGPPELMAEAWVTTVGFEADIWINGIRLGLGPIRNVNAGRELVMGGVRRQGNQITIRVKKIPAGKVKPRFEFGIYAAEGAGKPASRVFHFGPKEELPAELQMGFTGRLIK